ncbi:aminotransferase class IV [Candidatus Micrarchaeota archaeon]|nr:aminotransferase class IV [Candidatus Micrarchaeota archaeon]
MAEDYLFSGPVQTDEQRVGLTLIDRHGRLWTPPLTAEHLMDGEAEFLYFSKMGGFVPTEVAADSIVSNPAHYGAGGFEGIRLLRSRYGDMFPDLSHNIGRFIYSSMAFNLSLLRQTMAIFDDSEVRYVTHLQRTPFEFFADCEKILSSNGHVTMGVEVHYNDGRVENRRIPFKLLAKFGAEEREFTMREMEGVICALAYLNKIVRGPPFPAEGTALINSAYWRPWFWVSGEYGLKIPTVITREMANGAKILVDKPLYCAVATLPWKGSYLEPNRRLLLAPYERIGKSMPVSKKIAGCYVNSTLNINAATILTFGEVLAVNSDNQIVEGSAENLVFFVRDKMTNKLRAYFPPLSSKVLAGTNRNRAYKVLKVLEEGFIFQGQKVEYVPEAPNKDFVLNSLRGKTNAEILGVVLMGTGAGFVSAESITSNPELAEWMLLDELRSEETPPDPIILRRIHETSEELVINNRAEHPIVDIFRKACAELILSDNGGRITPPYAIFSNGCDNAEQIFGVSIIDAFNGDPGAARDFKAKADGGYFAERVNGLKQPDELMERHREASRVVRRMNDLSIGKRCTPINRIAQRV